MKSLHVPFHFYPDAVGGTEVYAFSLAQRLVAAGHDVHIAAPGESRSDYSYQSLPVHRFNTGSLEDIAGLYGEGDCVAAQQFGAIMDAVAPDLVHLHGMSPAISRRLLHQVKKRHIPVVLTVHIPGILCFRGTLLRYGADVCDGVVGVHKCGRCALQSRGLPRIAAQIAGTLPVLFGTAIARTGHQANWMTALRMTQLMNVRQTNLRAFLGDVDHIVAVSDWVRKTLVDNGIQSSRITLCRHGVTQTDLNRNVNRDVNRDPSSNSQQATVSNTKRIAFIGRLDKVKGAHLLVDAIVRSPDLPVRLDIYGIVQNASGSSYVESLLARAGRDERIRFLAPVPNVEVPGVLRGYDGLAVPSIWMETGPLVVYDAFMAGIPVIGSRRGGIAELVAHDRDGILVDPPEDTGAWSTALHRFCSEPGLIEKLRLGISAQRTMQAVATEMQELYESLLPAKTAHGSSVELLPA